MMISFEVATVIAVLTIFSVFYYYAGKAEKIVAAKAKAAREMRHDLEKPKAAMAKKLTAQSHKKKRKIVV